jgi:hypothetical protein
VKLQWFGAPLVQDGYAVVSSDGPKEYEVAFEALAGSEQQTLAPGIIAYIGTGELVLLQLCSSLTMYHCRSQALVQVWPTLQDELNLAARACMHSNTRLIPLRKLNA